MKSTPVFNRSSETDHQLFENMNLSEAMRIVRLDIGPEAVTRGTYIENLYMANDHAKLIGSNVRRYELTGADGVDRGWWEIALRVPPTLPAWLSVVKDRDLQTGHWTVQCDITDSGFGFEPHETVFIIEALTAAGKLAHDLNAEVN